MKFGSLWAVEKAKAQAFVFAFVFFIISLVISSYYVAGDQAFYREFYENVDFSSFGEAYKFYFNTLSARDPGYFMFIFLFSSWFEKNILFSLINSMLCYLLFLWLFKNKVNIFIVFILFFNFYLLVLAFAAERLKLAFLVFLWGYYFVGYRRNLIQLFSIGMHVQMVLFLVSICSGKIANVLFSALRAKVKINVYLIFALCMVCIMLFFSMDDLIAKFFIYYQHGEGAVIKPIFFTIMSILYAGKHRKEAFFASLPIVLVSFFIGSQRITMLSYFIFLYYAIQLKNGLNAGVIISSLFFAVKGILFLNNIFEHGDGFFSE